MFGASLLDTIIRGAGGQKPANLNSAAPNPSFNAGLIGSQNGFIGSSFNSILSSVNDNAQRGVSPFGNGANNSNLSPGQIAAQMQTGGAASIFPILGNKFLPKIMFPLAGLWSLVGGIKAIIGLRNEASAGKQRFDRNQLNYYKTTSQLEEVYANPVFRATQQQREFYGDDNGTQFNFGGGL